MAVGRSVSEVIPNTRLPAVLDNGVAEMGEVQHLGNKELATKRIPIKIKDEVVGAIASFQDVTQLQRFEQAIRQKLHSKGLVAKVSLNQIIGSSPALEAAKRQARRYAMSSSTVLITGESGTGKEMFAQSIHNLSSRDKSPFVAVNCAALPENLLESELLGYEEGAFTGAKKGGKQGLFELAHGGTMFLDEIGEMPLALQARLLRVLQEKEVMRLGGDRVIPVDVRVIAATNQDMAELVAKKQFREDLYYRLDILRLYLPPLRDRKGDIPMLVEYFYRKLNLLNPTVKGIAPEALTILEKLSWPGNVRELVNLMERALLLSDNEVVTAEDIRSILPAQAASLQADSLPGEYGNLEDMEKETIEQILREEKFNYTRAASRLGINRTTLWRKIQKQNR
jgi:transcriptional regulator with PAS, ATPase and Fis domain